MSYLDWATTTTTTTGAGKIDEINSNRISVGSNGLNITTICKSPLEIEGEKITGKDIEFIHNLQKQYQHLQTEDLQKSIQKTLDLMQKNALTTRQKAVNDLKKEIQEERENKGMDIMKNFNFGPCGDRAKISHLGIAVQNTNGEWVSYDKENGEIVNVDLINFGSNNFVYMLPVALKDVAVGDVIIHNHHVVFVTRTREKNLSVIDVTDGEVKKILPTKSIFGFDFVTKIVSLVDFTASTANADNPFGNMLPFLLLGNNENKSTYASTKENDALPLVLMMMMNSGQKDGGLFSSMDSPMQTMLMLTFLNSNKDSNMQTLLPMMLLMNKNESTKTATQ